jgi:hypothetical protein
MRAQSKMGRAGIENGEKVSERTISLGKSPLPLKAAGYNAPRVAGA